MSVLIAIGCSDAIQKKEADENKDVELSKNAQFHAIQPANLLFLLWKKM